eukprot:TRINITY_DN2199_c0_g1_i8.p1 TRINITY_DN2199_c0_g1~~TRINITY_DN2199_c0_g1_i8.p1  ORF type:complete len:101 (+),score=32.00 TRINITY_DN2199_c0_g1_i8:172-474(+)
MCIRDSQERYRELLGEHCPTGEVLLERSDQGLSIGKQIVQVSEREEVDASFIVLGSVGMSCRTAYLGSTAKHCVNHARVNVVVVKEQSGSSSSRFGILHH